MIGAISGAICVILGAFGAHALVEKIPESSLSSYKTGNTYHFCHSILLLIIGLITKTRNTVIMRYAGIFCMAGILFFSGSLYILSCRTILGISSTGILGPMTPIGGVFFVISWSLIAVEFFKKSQKEIGDERI